LYDATINIRMVTSIVIWLFRRSRIRRNREHFRCFNCM